MKIQFFFYQHLHLFCIALLCTLLMRLTYWMENYLLTIIKTTLKNSSFLILSIIKISYIFIKTFYLKTSERKVIMLYKCFPYSYENRIALHSEKEYFNLFCFVLLLISIGENKILLFCNTN